MRNELIPLQTWPAMLPLELAEHDASLGAPINTEEEICEHFGITLDELETFKKNPSFRAEVRAAILEIKDSNSVVKKKAKAQFEFYLDKLVPNWLSDPEFPPAEKTKLLMFLAKTGRIVDDPVEKAKAEAESNKSSQGSQVPTINLILAEPKSLQPFTITPEKVINE